MSQKDQAVSKIQKHIPPPRPSRVPNLPLDQMQVGHSVLVTYATRHEAAALRQRLQRWQKTHPKTRFSTRRINDHQMRIWRIEDV